MANGKRMNVDAVAKAYEPRLSKMLKRIDRDVTFVSILTSEDHWSERYQELIGRDCEKLRANGSEDGPRVVHRGLYAGSEAELDEMLGASNDDNAVDGIMLFNPLGKKIKRNRLDYSNGVKPEKDVEGFHYTHVGKLFQEFSEDLIVSPTARAVVEVLDLHKYPYLGTATVINRSDVVGKPLRAILEHKGMTVFAAFDGTNERHTNEMITHSDLIVTSVPDPLYRLPVESIPAESTVIAVNPTNVDDAMLESKCKHISSGKNPIGRITRNITIYNLLKLVERREK